MLRGGSDQEITATSEVMDKARTFSGGWLGTARARGEPEGWSGRQSTGPGLAAQPQELQVREGGTS